MAVPISNVTRRVVYAASGTGPYAFTFEILAQTDIEVYKGDTKLTLTTDYSVTINANGTGSVTLVATAGTDNITIIGARAIQRTTDFVTGGDLFANTINDELDSLTIFAQQNSEAVSRALQAPETDPTTINMTLPRAATRANKTLAFDSDGNPVIGEIIGDNRGNWAASTIYNKRDLVKDTSNNNIYLCNTAHTSSGSQPISTNTDAAKWDLLVDAAAAAAAQAAAEAAQSAAEDAQTAAETAETNAASSASAASTSASNAASSASAASTSATNAASSASTASTAATNAGNSATAAAASETAAAASESAAATSASNASTSASNASTSASNAASSASAASTSETNAASSASAASTSASNAATSASNASSSATDAATAQAAAESALAEFNATYLGAQASDPTLDNEGDPVTAGDWYFNTSSNLSRIYNGSSWQTVVISTEGFAELGSAQTFTAQQTFTELKETTYTLGTSGSIALDPANGSIQSSTLSGNPTFTDSLEAGQVVVLMLNGGASYTVTWPTITWVTSTGDAAPTLTANDTLVLWKVSTTLYGAYVGSYA